jgi:hypothetical protein
MKGIIGSMLTQHLIPESTNFIIVSKTLVVGGVPGSMIRFIFSSIVVIDQTIKQLEL